MGFRSIICNLHGRNFRGHGITRVLNGIMYTFCRHCWRNRFEECESLMRETSAINRKAAKASA